MRRPQIAGRVTVQRSTLSLCFIKPERLVGTGASNCRNLWTYYNPVCLPVVLWCARFYRLPSDGQCRCHAYRHPSLYVSRNSRQWFVLHSVACIHGTPYLSCPTIISLPDACAPTLEVCSEYILVVGLPQQCYVILVHLPGVSHDDKIVTKRETLPEVINHRYHREYSNHYSF